MSFAVGHPEVGRGEDLLLAHCAVLNAVEARRKPVLARLRHLIGPDLTRLLLVSLAGDHGTRPRLTV